MKIILTPEDQALIKKISNIDFKELIEASGHECIIATSKPNLPQNITYTLPALADYVMAYQQNDYINYHRLCAMTGIYPNRQRELILLNKLEANKKLEELGLNYLNTANVSSIEDIINFADDMVILKPKMSMGSKSEYDFMYTPMQKSELLAKINASNINLTTEEYVIQEAVVNNKPIIWVGGFINPEGKIHIDGVLDQYFSPCEQYFENRIRYPERHLVKTEEVQLTELNDFHKETIRQIKIVLESYGAKCTPFCIQSITDDDDEVQLLDFNFGFGKSYMIHVRQDNPQYIIDRLKYTYGGADSIEIDTTHLINIYVDTPNGITDEIKNYISDKPIYKGFGQPDRDFVNTEIPGAINHYHRYRSRFVCVGQSKEESTRLLTEFETFINSLNT